MSFIHELRWKQYVVRVSLFGLVLSDLRGLKGRCSHSVIEGQASLG